MESGAREGLRSFGTVPKHGATHPRPEGTGASALKAVGSSAPTLAGCRAAHNRPCRAPLPSPHPRLPGRSPAPAHAALCTCPWASALSRPRSFCCWRPPWVPHLSLRLGHGGGVSGERAAGKHLRVASTMSTSFSDPTPSLPRAKAFK